jgi:adenine-specific DNA methylase
MKFLQALPPYFGGKQALLKTIFGLLPGAQQCPTLADAFLGGGSISLYAKAMGYRVRCNDLAERSAVIGRGLIENGRVKVNKQDVGELIKPNDFTLCQKDPVNKFFTPDDALLIDTIRGNLGQKESGLKKDLFTLALINFILRSRHHGDFGVQWTYDTLRAKENTYLPLGHMRSARIFLKSPIDRFMKEIEKSNRAVFSNGEENVFTQADVLEFLEHTRADIAYFDPPYYGSIPYEKVYKVLDWILAGEIKEPTVSEFNKNQAFSLIEDMLERAEWAKIWVFSYGGPKADRRKVVDMVKKRRKMAKEIPVNYKYRHGNHQPDSENRDTEILIFAER